MAKRSSAIVEDSHEAKKSKKTLKESQNDSVETPTVGGDAKALRKAAKKAAKAAAASALLVTVASPSIDKAAKKAAKKAKKQAEEVVVPAATSSEAASKGGDGKTEVALAGETFQNREELLHRIDELKISGRKEGGLTQADLLLGRALCAAHPSLLKAMAASSKVVSVRYGTHERFPGDECFLATVAAKKKKKKGEAAADGDGEEVPLGFKKVVNELFGKGSKKSKKGASADAGGVVSGGGDNVSTTAPAAGSTAAASISYDTFEATPFHPGMKALLAETFPGLAPTPIQAQSWGIALQGHDLIAVAKTGSGKTLAFLLPLFHALNQEGISSSSSSPPPRVLVLAPTRELAMQIHAECVKFGKLFTSATAAAASAAAGEGVAAASFASTAINSVCLYGGVPIHAQIKALEGKGDAGVSVVVATPGRLCDLLTRKSVDLSGALFVVLDEADRMLDMGFQKQIDQIFAALPPKQKRQTLFFTATWPKSVRSLAETMLNQDGDDGSGGGGGGAGAGKKGVVKVFVGASEDAELEANTSVTQTFVHATDDEKDNKLWAFLSTLTDQCRVVVFTNTKRRADVGAKNFASFGTCAIHGDKPQNERDEALKEFVDKKRPLMFATDVAARGLDIKGVSHVVNFDMARDVESYVHRIGRTGRAGSTGEALTFWNPDYDKACTAALCKIARAAGQAVPEWLAKHEGQKAAKQWRVEDAEKALLQSAAEQQEQGP